MNICITMGILFTLLAGKRVFDILQLRTEEERLEISEEGKAV